MDLERKRATNRECQRRFWQSRTPEERKQKREQYAINRALRVMEREKESEVQEN